MGKNTIVIADDDSSDISLIRRTFEAAKVTNILRMLNDGDTVMEYLAGSGRFEDRNLNPYPVLLLLDLKMPHRSGFEVLEWIQMNPKHAQLPVVVLTAINDVRDIQRAYELGAHSFLIKPLEISDLTNLINGLRGVKVETSEEGLHLLPG